MRASKILWGMQYLNFRTLELITYQSFYLLGEFVSKVGFKLYMDQWIMGAPYLLSQQPEEHQRYVGPCWSSSISIGRRKRIWSSFSPSFAILVIYRSKWSQAGTCLSKECECMFIEHAQNVGLTVTSVKKICMFGKNWHVWIPA